MKTPTIKYPLLDHPFYQAWNEGKISQEQLSSYAQSYLELICEIPNLWEKVIKNFNEKSPIADKVIAEEQEHIGLWEKWQSEIPAKESPSMQNLISKLQAMTPSELLGAIHSFEIQQPSVAKTKKDGLMKHYGFSAESLNYFDEHMHEEEHIAFGYQLAKKSANHQEFEEGFNKGSKLFYDALDLFLTEEQKMAVSC